MPLNTRFSVTPAPDTSSIQNPFKFNPSEQESTNAIPMENLTDSNTKCNEYQFHQVPQLNQLNNIDNIVEQPADDVAIFWDLKAMTQR